MFRLQAYGELVSSTHVVQVGTPERRYSNLTETMPLCASDAVAVRFTVPDSGATGTVRDTVGAVLSTRTFDSLS